MPLDCYNFKEKKCFLQTWLTHETVNISMIKNNSGLRMNSCTLEGLTKTCTCNTVDSFILEGMNIQVQGKFPFSWTFDFLILPICAYNVQSL